MPSDAPSDAEVEETNPVSGLVSLRRKELEMLWSWLFSQESKLFKPFKTYLYHHSKNAFHMLLFGGDVILIIVWSLEWFFPHHAAYHLWLAGLTATLALLSVSAIKSTRMHGYRRHRDLWAERAIALMFVLCLVSVLSTI